MHTFRKYISNRGSALFMVISTMTALMITCMAMYFTVVASRSTTYTIFNQKQSYQNALSIFEMVKNEINAGTGDLFDKMDKMEISDAPITSNGTDDLLGEYNIVIDRFNDEANGDKAFDIMITITVDGVSETVHSQITYPPKGKLVEGMKDPNVSISPTFAATGYVPNDVYLDMGYFMSDMYYDNEVTYFGAYEGSELFGYRDINCSGSVVICDSKSMTFCNDGKPIVFSVRNNLTVPRLGRDPGMKQGSKIYVGGNLSQSWEIKSCDIYVNGDLYLYSGNYNGSGTRYFVNGNVHKTADQTPDIWCNGKVYDGSGNELTNVSKGTWTEKANSDNTVMKYDDMLLDLDNRTQTNPYYKWTINETEVPDVKLEGGNHQTITFDNNNRAYITYGDSTWKKGCVVDDIDFNGYNQFFIIVDTGDDPSNVYTMRLQANRTGPDGKKNIFSWSGERGDNGVFPRIFLKGKGSLVIDVPGDVIYQETNYSIISHYNWWMLNGNAPIETVSMDASDGVMLTVGNLEKYVIDDCTECNKADVVKTEASEEKCTRIVTRKNGVKDVCGEVKQTLTCSVHGNSITYCSKCEKPFVQDYKGEYNFCKSHVDKKAVQSAYDSAGNKEYWDRDKDGNVIYPTTNLYLISSAESAKFRFGQRADGTNIEKNTMIGYIYAPYLTFSAKGSNTGNNAIKFMGGMTVSDYNFVSAQTFIMCKPESNPTDLMSDSCLSTVYVPTKDWKITLKTH